MIYLSLTELYRICSGIIIDNGTSIIIESSFSGLLFKESSFFWKMPLHACTQSLYCKCHERDKTQRRDATSTVSWSYTKRNWIWGRSRLTDTTNSSEACQNLIGLFPFRKATANKSQEVRNLGSFDSAITRMGMSRIDISL